MVSGCTNPLACNFQDVANDDDGTCDFVSCLTSGCTLPNACNYDANAAILDEAVRSPQRAWTEMVQASTLTPTACVTCLKFSVAPTRVVNFDEAATDNDGSCVYANGGCTDVFVCNFNHLATANDGSCDYGCLGCMSIHYVTSTPSPQSTTPKLVNSCWTWRSRERRRSPQVKRKFTQHQAQREPTCTGPSKAEPDCRSAHRIHHGDVDGRSRRARAHRSHGGRVRG